ncbi:YonK family protein [uncultured Clostridium sp.]|uniref:YonK family protein n=1 Tax=uncultured Clostridium sp. TaxID=59620 RepID=UPI003217DD32
MAKENKSIQFSKAIITEEDGEFIITEYQKEDTKVYNLNEKLREWLDIEGITLSLKKDKELPSEE